MQAIEVLAGVTGDPMGDPAVVREMASRYLIWDAFVGGSRRVELRPLVLSPELHRRAVSAAEGVVQALGATSRLAFEDPSERDRYGFDHDVVRLAGASYRAGDSASLVRVDLLLDRELRWTACEVNADCPGGLNEAQALPRFARAAGFRAGTNPTCVVEALTSRLAALASPPGEPAGAVALTYATAYAEDLQICAFLQRALQRAGVEAILTPPTAPRLRHGALCVGSRPVRAVYRYFPTEYMDGLASVDALADATERGEVRSSTAFQWMYLQSKTVMARAWARRGELAHDDASAVDAHVPFSVDVAELPAERLMRERESWVLKRALGRVGDEVFVGSLWTSEDWSEAVTAVQARRATGERWIAQRFVEQHAVPTPWGDRFVTLGAYVLDGRFVGYFARVTPSSHVSHDALVVPVFVDDRPGLRGVR